MEYDRRYLQLPIHSQPHWPGYDHSSPNYDCGSYALPPPSQALSGSDGDQAQSSQDRHNQHISPWPDAQAAPGPKFTPHLDQPRRSPPRRSIESAPQPIAASKPSKPVASAGPAHVISSLPAPRRTLTDNDRLDMCHFAERNPNLKQTEIGGKYGSAFVAASANVKIAKFGVERRYILLKGSPMAFTDQKCFSTVSKVLRNKDKYIIPDDGTKSLRRRSGKNPDIERTLLNWIRNHVTKGNTLTDAAIRLQLEHFMAVDGGRTACQKRFNGEGWLKKFKSENNISSVADSVAIKSHKSPESQHSSPDSKEPGIISPIKLENHEEPQSKRHRSRKRKHEARTPPVTAICQSPVPTEAVTAAPSYPWPSQYVHSPLTYDTGSVGWQYRSPHYNLPNPNLYAEIGPLMSPASYPTPMTTHATYYGLSSPSLSSRLSMPYLPSHPPPSSYHCSPHEQFLSYYSHHAQPACLYDSPTVDQATEALQTLQRYVKRETTSLDQSELDTIRKLESIKLRPSPPVTQSPPTSECFSTSSCYIHPPHDLLGMETGHVR